MQIVAVAAVLSNAKGDVLLVRSAKAGWEIPGGRVEAGEDLFAALARELDEEAGCTAEIDRLVGIYAHVRQALLVLIYRGTSHTDSPAPRPDEPKVLEAGWFAPAEALRMVTHPSEHEELADALADPPAPIYRVF